MGDQQAQCDRHEQDLYRGDCTMHGITTRVLVLEQSMESILFYMRWMLVTTAGILVTAIVRLVIK